MNFRAIFAAVFVILLVAGSIIFLLPGEEMSSSEWPTPSDKTTFLDLLSINGTKNMNVVEVMPLKYMPGNISLPKGGYAVGIYMSYRNVTPVIAIIAFLNSSASSVANKIVDQYRNYNPTYKTFKDSGYMELRAENIILQMWYRGKWIVEVATQSGYDEAILEFKSMMSQFKG
ncbi:MAG: DUF3242 domain-containing protein [Candidatus Methanodesulfokora washburnensis]